MILAIFTGDLRTLVIAAVVVVGAVCIWAVDRYLSRPVEWHLDDDDAPVISSLYEYKRERRP